MKCIFCNEEMVQDSLKIFCCPKYFDTNPHTSRVYSNGTQYLAILKGPQEDPAETFIRIQINHTGMHIVYSVRNGICKEFIFDKSLPIRKALNKLERIMLLI